MFIRKDFGPIVYSKRSERTRLSNDLSRSLGAQYFQVCATQLAVSAMVDTAPLATMAVGAQALAETKREHEGVGGAVEVTVRPALLAPLSLDIVLLGPPRQS